MNRSVRWIAVGVAVGLCLPALSGAAPEANKEANSDDKGKYIDELMLAYRLAEIGRDKERPSPEALVTAATLLKRLTRVRFEALAEKPEIEGGAKGEKLVDQVVPVSNLEEEAKELLNEARIRAVEMKFNIDPLINAIEKREAKGMRAVVGGPKQINRAIGPGQRQTFHLKVKPQQPVHFGFRGSIPLKVMIVRPDINNIWGGGIVPSANATFHPGPASKRGQPVSISISIVNVSKQRATYRMLVN